ncbi:MAG: RnfABCDGE type electron transport complex subunit G [Desulfobacterales bacterium]
MREMVKMVIVLTVLSSFSGGLLAAIHNETKDRIEYQQLKFVKGPAIREILKEASNDPLVDRFKITDGDIERSFFVGIIDGKANTVAYESSDKGFGGEIGIMVGVNINDDKIVGMGVTTHSETPGVGSKAKTDPGFSDQFKGLSIDGPFKVKTDGGQVDAITGATITSRGVSGAVTAAGEMYKQLKPQIVEKLKDYNKDIVK